MKKINLKNNNGFTVADVTIGIIIITLLVGVIYNMYVQIALTSAKIQLQAIANMYAIKATEYIDYIGYDEVTEQLNNPENRRNH